MVQSDVQVLNNMFDVIDSEEPSNLEDAVNAVRHNPAPALSDYIDAIWHVKSNNPQLLEAERYLPNGHFEMIIDLEEAFMQMDDAGNWIKAPQAFVGGMYARHFFVRPSGKVNRLSVVFKPGTIHHFMPENAQALGGCNTNLEDLLGRESYNKLDDLRGKKDAHSAMLSDHLQQTLFEMMRPADCDAIVDESINRIQCAQGHINMSGLARKLHISERHFRRRFKQSIGMSPKHFAKITRVLSAFSMGKKNRNVTVSDLAYELGYFDRSHFDREFVSIVGLSPAQCFTERNILFEEVYIN